MQITDTLSLRLLAERAPSLTTPHQLTALRHILVERYAGLALAQVPDDILGSLIDESVAV